MIGVPIAARRTIRHAGCSALLALLGCSAGSKSYLPHDNTLRREPLFFYPAQSNAPKAFVLFIGNDIGFWKPHEELATRLSRAGYAVVGLDIKKYLAKLPAEEPARDSSFSVNIASLIARARSEVGADSVPAIVGGHSFGAEVAFWIALHRPPAHLAGVLAMSPRSTGHLVVTPLDLLNKEASGPWSFSTIRASAELPPHVRIAIVRGASDPFRKHDSLFAVAGGARFHYYPVPFAGHSLRRLIIAGPIVEHAVNWLLSTERTATVDASR